MNKTKLRVCVTEKCNINCIYCRPGGEGPITEDKDILSIDQMIKLIDLLAKYGVSVIKVTGGEPFLNKGIDNIFKKIRQINKIEKLSVVTNGNIMSPLILNSILENSLNSVTVSLDTLNEENYYNITKYNTFNKVIENIDLLLKNNVYVKINCVLMKQNYAYIYDLIEYCKDKQIDIKILDLVSYDKTFWQKEFIPLKELVENLKKKCKVYELHREDEGLGVPEHSFIYGNIHINIKDSYQGAYYFQKCLQCIHYPCQSGIGALVLKSNGFLSICALADKYPLDLNPYLNSNCTNFREIDYFFDEYSRNSYKKLWQSML